MEEDTVVGLPRLGRTVENDPLLCVLRQSARRVVAMPAQVKPLSLLMSPITRNTASVSTITDPVSTPLN